MDTRVRCIKLKFRCRQGVDDMEILDLRTAEAKNGLMLSPMIADKGVLYCLVSDIESDVIRFVTFNPTTQDIKRVELPHEDYVPIGDSCLAYLHHDRSDNGQDVWGVYWAPIGARGSVRRLCEFAVPCSRYYRGREDIRRYLSCAQASANMLVISYPNVFHPTPSYAARAIELAGGSVQDLGDYAHSVTFAHELRRGQEQYLIMGIGTCDGEDQMFNWQLANRTNQPYSRPWDASIVRLQRNGAGDWEEDCVLAEAGPTGSIDRVWSLAGRLVYMATDFPSYTRTVVIADPLSGAALRHVLPYRSGDSIIEVNGRPFLWVDSSQFEILDSAGNLLGRQCESTQCARESAVPSTSAPGEWSAAPSVGLRVSYPEQGTLLGLLDQTTIHFPGELGMPVAVFENNLVCEGCLTQRVFIYDLEARQLVEEYHGTVVVLPTEKLVVICQ